MSPTATRTVEIMRQAHVVGDIVAWRDVLHEGPVPALPRGRAAPAARGVPRNDGPGEAAEVEADLRARDERLDAARRGGRARRAVVRARPLRPAAAAADPRRAARPPGRGRADLRRLVPRPPGLRRPRRARARRAREPVAGARAGHPRARARGARGLGRLPRHRPARARARGRRRRTSGCRSSRRRCGGCWRSCPAPATASRARSASCWPPSRRAPARASRPSSPRPRTRRRRSSATRSRSTASRSSPAGRSRSSRRTPSLELTAAGADVLAGRADRVALNGFDRWLGGTAPARRGRAVALGRGAGRARRALTR